uniref:Uncharacterized protein n=1 Tax=Strigamia maritima TaxID=126957 RepID=T1IZ55_STRMM
MQGTLFRCFFRILANFLVLAATEFENAESGKVNDECQQTSQCCENYFCFKTREYPGICVPRPNTNEDNFFMITPSLRLIKQ